MPPGHVNLMALGWQSISLGLNDFATGMSLALELRDLSFLSCDLAWEVAFVLTLAGKWCSCRPGSHEWFLLQVTVMTTSSCRSFSALLSVLCPQISMLLGFRETLSTLFVFMVGTSRWAVQFGAFLNEAARFPLWSSVTFVGITGCILGHRYSSGSGRIDFLLLFFFFFFSSLC